MTAPVRPDLDALAALEEQRAFLRRSLADLDREHEAGDLDETDFTALHADYEDRLAALSAAIDDGKAAFATAPRRGPGRTALIVGLVAVFAVACGFGVAQLAGRRTVTDTATGDSRTDPRTLLTQCLSEINGDVTATVACYDGVLKVDPTNVEAQTYKAGIQLMANNDLTQMSTLIDVVTADPTYPDAHAFLAVGFDRIGSLDSALAELHKLDTLNTSPFIKDLVSGLRADLEATAASTTTTAPPP
jgi:cytochrome c-type biogenesis protein CcmI